MSYLEAGERLWLRVNVADPGSCWEWQGTVNSHGYGTIRDHCLSRGCHVVAYESRVGPVPSGLMVCHTCDNRKCCNPSHLFLGTALDNNRDRVRKGRCNSARGRATGHAKLTEHDAALIRLLVSLGARQRPFCRLFDVSPMAINAVVHRRTWTHVADLPRCP